MWRRLRQALGSEPELTWLEAESPEIRLPHAAADRVRGRRWRLQANWPLIAGTLVVVSLFGVVLFGPWLAPENPYLAGQRSSMIIEGEFTTPPFPPMLGLPLGTDEWGRDILSILLYGTRNTLVACLFIAMARVLMGSLLGMAAGWNEGGSLDRAVMGLVELTTALPALLTGMLLILSLGIQRGIVIFIISLCFVGWGEIAQYIRSEFMVVRRKPFIEGARVVGLDALRITVRHVLPNVLPSLVVISVLEMGAVLMILGELGFIGVFIGGGSWVQVGDTAVANIPDIPEWGAMMAGARQFARSQPWMVFYPALAFFFAVLGFNLLGEGLRRIVQQRGVSTAFILSKRMLLVIAAISLATVYIVTHVGPAPSYAGLAQRFDARTAMSHLQALTAAEKGGRQAGTPGAAAAAEYIAARFAECGLEPISPQFDFRLPVTSRTVLLTEMPQLELRNLDGQLVHSFTYLVDFGVDINGHGGPGQAEAPVAAIAFSKALYAAEEFKGLDLRGRVVAYLLEAAPPGFAVEALLRGASGILLIDEDAVPRLQLADPQSDYLRNRTLPVFRIPPATAHAILAPDGLSVEELRNPTVSGQEAQSWTVHELSVQVKMRLSLSAVQQVTADNVLALFEGADARLNKELVIVSAPYDAGGPLPNGTVLQGANNSASGVATMLEIARLWKTTGFQPRRTVMFAAWTGGDWEHSGAHEYMSAQAAYSILQTVAVVHLGGLGRGGNELLINGDAGLVNLILRSADSSAVPASEGRTARHLYEQALTAPSVTVSWTSEPTLAADDNVDQISVDQLGQAGQVVNLALITLSREYQY